jgi:hypothetical protein
MHREEICVGMVAAGMVGYIITGGKIVSVPEMVLYLFFVRKFCSKMYLLQKE